MSSPIGELPNEILVAILRTVPTRDLLLSQRVCKQWRAIIIDSHELQAALFLRPSSGPFPGWKRTYTPLAKSSSSGYKDPTSGFTCQQTWLPGISAGLVHLVGDTRPAKPSFDELGKDEVAARFFDDMPGSGALTDDEGWSCSANPRDNVAYAELSHVHGQLNPMFWAVDEDAPNEPPTVDNFVYYSSSFDLRGDQFISSAKWRNFRCKMLQSGPDASWRRMYVTQPPVKRLWIRRIHDATHITPDDFCYSGTTGLCKMENDITMGDLVARLRGTHVENGDCRYIFNLEGLVCPNLSQEKQFTSALASGILPESRKKTGVVKLWDRSKGCGFIAPEGSSTAISFKLADLIEVRWNDKGRLIASHADLGLVLGAGRRCCSCGQSSEVHSGD